MPPTGWLVWVLMLFLPPLHHLHIGRDVLPTFAGTA